MLLHNLLVGAVFATAIAVTVVFTSFAAASAYAPGAGEFALRQTIPNYLLRWDNPLLPSAPVAPTPSR
jgi:hypothetical protein